MTHEQHTAHGEHRHGPGCGHETTEHGNHVDYVHGGHRHAEHGDHWDEHGDVTMAGQDYGSSDSVGVSRTDSGPAASTWAEGPGDRPEGVGDTGGS